MAEESEIHHESNSHLRPEKCSFGSKPQTPVEASDRWILTQLGGSEQEAAGCSGLPVLTGEGTSGRAPAASLGVGSGLMSASASSLLEMTQTSTTVIESPVAYLCLPHLGVAIETLLIKPGVLAQCFGDTGVSGCCSQRCSPCCREPESLKTPSRYILNLLGSE